MYGSHEIGLHRQSCSIIQHLLFTKMYLDTQLLDKRPYNCPTTICSSCYIFCSETSINMKSVSIKTEKVVCSLIYRFSAKWLSPVESCKLFAAINVVFETKVLVSVGLEDENIKSWSVIIEANRIKSCLIA